MVTVDAWRRLSCSGAHEQIPTARHLTEPARFPQSAAAPGGCGNLTAPGPPDAAAQQNPSGTAVRANPTATLHACASTTAHTYHTHASPTNKHTHFQPNADSTAHPLLEETSHVPLAPVPPVHTPGFLFPFLRHKLWPPDQKETAATRD